MAEPEAPVDDSILEAISQPKVEEVVRPAIVRKPYIAPEKTYPAKIDVEVNKNDIFGALSIAKQAVIEFAPNPTVLMYTCGITPYDATHLGHAFTFISYDVLQRRLIDMGHEVKCVRNVTDVDDPLFAKARELGVHYLDLAAGEEARC